MGLCTLTPSRNGWLVYPYLWWIMKESGEESGRMSEDGRLVMMRQLGASLFFGMSSIFIVMVNKFVLTVFK